MGQYHTIYSVDAKEYFHIGGAKLWEKVSTATAQALLLLLSNSNARCGGDFYIYAERHDPKTYEPIYSDEELDKQAAIDLVSGRWAGHRIVVQGDYAVRSDKRYLSEGQTNQYKDISYQVWDALKALGDEEICKAIAFEEECSGRTKAPKKALKPKLEQVPKVQTKTKSKSKAKPKPKAETKTKTQVKAKQIKATKPKSDKSTDSFADKAKLMLEALSKLETKGA